MKYISIVAVVFTLLIGCQDNVSEPSAEIESVEKTKGETKFLSEPVHINLTAVGAEAGLPKLTGETNLPDGMGLMMSISNKELGYSAQAKVTVSGGRYESEIFSDGGQALSDGQYIASLVMPIPSVQPDSVKGIIGQNGEHLTGSLIESGMLGKSLEIEHSFIVGESAESAISAQSDVAQQNQETAQKVETEIKLLLEVSNNLIALEKNGQDQECVELLHPAQKRAKENSALADTLPNSYPLLKVAATETVVCLTCLNPDKATCDQASNSLAEHNTAN